MKTQIRQVTKVTLFLVVAGLILQGIPGWAGFNPKKRLRRPGNRQAAATRTDCSNPEPSLAMASSRATGEDEKLLLTTLVPQLEKQPTQELTIDAYPTFHWYMSEEIKHPAAQFVLYMVSQTEPHIEQVEIFRTQFQLKDRAGIASLKLPAEAMVPALEVGQIYHWQVNLLCPDAESPDEDNQYIPNVSVAGWMKRVEPSAAFVAQLDIATPTERFDLLAENGLWYDALTQLTTLRRENPKDETLAAEWSELFNSEYVQLPEIASMSVE